jgi:putative ABC transport system permease protein
LSTHELYGVQPHDSGTMLMMPLLMVIVAIAASVFPARRAARVDPAIALRAD